MPRQSLYADNLLKDGYLFEDFENIGDFTATGGTISADTDWHTSGAKSLKATTNPGAVMEIVKTFQPSPAMRRYSCRMEFDLNILTDKDATFGSFWITFKNADSTKFCRIKYWSVANPQVRNGVNHVSLDLISGDAMLSFQGNPAFDEYVKMYIQVNAKSGQVLVCSIDNMRIGQVYKPLICLTYDDGYTSEYDRAFAYTQTKGVYGTLYNIVQGTGSAAGRLSLAQLQEMYEAGWDIGNHTDSHTPFTTLSQSDQEKELSICAKWLVSNGMERAAYDVAYVGGFHTYETMKAMKNTGMKTGRTVGSTSPNSGFSMNPVTRECGADLEWNTMYTLPAKSFSVITQQQANAYIDFAIANQCTLIPMFHRIVDVADGENCTTAVHNAFIDYGLARGAEFVTISQLRQRILGHPRKTVSSNL